MKTGFVTGYIVCTGTVTNNRINRINLLTVLTAARSKLIG